MLLFPIYICFKTLIYTFLCYFQVQDYYVALKFNQGTRCIKALYRLCVACCMLHYCRNAGATRGHPYPKIMLLFMLVLRHWRATRFCAYEMMKTNMSMFNEELGELTFSILARSVLGDHTRDDFDHMDRLFRLLKVYRDVKSDVVADNSNASNSLNWRHKINKVGDEVTSTQLFFKRIIRQMVAGTYQSYDGSPKCYTNAQCGSELSIASNSPLVYMSFPELDAYLKNLMAVIRVDMNTNFLFPYSHIWPECINLNDLHNQDDMVIVAGPKDVPDNGEEIEVDVIDFKQELEHKQADQAEDGDVDKDDDKQEEVEEEVEDGPDPDHAVNPFEQRGWEAWGTVNAQNQMVGKRKTNPVQRLGFSGRRRGGAWPDPDV